ncbi:hypothetical protein AB835_12285 [Candidatus Endobugula sertula]|uniref:Uncharacterized protein n=1 Tax=Candidatus Endobugula sertula TaxID=62101 RepID=A0A1D2QMK2_9GAMM|nr:hypothetical protein AB835_12285 [Candidatus Endobugula sertula]
MSKRKSKATQQLRQFQRVKKELSAKLTQLDDDLYNLLQSHQFYQQAVIALVEENTEPEYWVIEALTTQRWLRQSGEQLINRLNQAGQQLNH